ncbi:MAG: NAD-dependent epimerase/dehydratase family protein [Polyangiaceae bacterium]|nr:NAD-dependent epimerase/dehydratase family protein [Polyangiaceae bacterium]
MASALSPALVLGATGHIGSAVVRELISRGARVTAVSRKSEAPKNLEGLSVNFVSGDVAQPGLIDELVRGHALVVDAAVPYPVWMFRPTTLEEKDPYGVCQKRTESILSAVGRAGASLALVGSFTTLPHPGDAKGDWEPQTLRRSHPYFVVKEIAENLTLAAARKGLNAVIVNPTAFLGPWDGKAPERAFLPALVRSPVHLTTSRIANFVDVRDVASVLVNAILRGRFGKKLPIVGHNIGLDELTERVTLRVGSRAPRFHASTRVGAAFSYWMEAAAAAVGRQAPFPALPALLLRYGYPMEVSEEQRELLRDLTPLDKSIADALDWYKRIGYV